MTRTRLSLSELLESEEDLLVLIGAEDDQDGGADQDDQDEDENDDASGEDGDGSDDENDEDEGEDGEDDEDVPGLKARIVALEKEKDRHFRKAAREKKRADAAEAKLAGTSSDKAGKPGDKDKDADSSESTRVTAVNKTLAVQNSFLMTNKNDFVNNQAALKLLDLSEVDISDDGEVEGMEDAIDQLVKDHPYLLKKKPAPASRKTGDKPSSTTKNSERSAAARKRELEDRYPALRNR